MWGDFPIVERRRRGALRRSVDGSHWVPIAGGRTSPAWWRLSGRGDERRPCRPQCGAGNTRQGRKATDDLRSVCRPVHLRLAGPPRLRDECPLPGCQRWVEMDLAAFPPELPYVGRQFRCARGERCRPTISTPLPAPASTGAPPLTNPPPPHDRRLCFGGEQFCTDSIGHRAEPCADLTSHRCQTKKEITWTRIA